MYEEILGIDTSIVIHEIRTYPNAKEFHQKLGQVHPRKASTIKEDIEKNVKVGFICPVPLTKWVSNIVLVDQKHGTNRVCIDFWDLN